MNIPYVETMEAEWMASYKPLKTTGRWKVESCEYYKNKLFIEHQGFIFKSWIPEENIKWLPDRQGVINECN